MTDLHKSLRMTVAGSARTAAIALIGIYRLVVSPLLTALLGPACRFRPTCSEYARDAVAEYGVLRGSELALRRLLRCRPLGGFGYDPVPPNSAPYHDLPKI